MVEIVKKSFTNNSAISVISLKSILLITNIFLFARTCVISTAFSKYTKARYKNRWHAFVLSTGIKTLSESGLQIRKFPFFQICFCWFIFIVVQYLVAVHFGSSDFKAEISLHNFSETFSLLFSCILFYLLFTVSVTSGYPVVYYFFFLFISTYSFLHKSFLKKYIFFYPSSVCVLILRSFH